MSINSEFSHCTAFGGSPKIFSYTSDINDESRQKLIEQQVFWQVISDSAPEICRLDEGKCLC
jgi:hypothetical protein